MSQAIAPATLLPLPPIVVCPGRVRYWTEDAPRRVKS
jgi:hypothetical protein